MASSAASQTASTIALDQPPGFPSILPSHLEESLFKPQAAADADEAPGKAESALWCSQTQPPPLYGLSQHISPAPSFTHDACDGSWGHQESTNTLSHPLALQLSFDASEPPQFLPASAPAGLPSFPHVHDDLTSPPLLEPFEYPVPAEAPMRSVSQSSSFRFRSPYVHTFRLPGATTPPAAPLSRSTPHSSGGKPTLHPSPSLSAALSVLEQTPPWTQREAESQTNASDGPFSSLFTTLDAAVETLSRRPRRSDASSPKRPKPLRSSTEPYPSPSSTDSAPHMTSPKSPSRSKGKKRPEGHIPRAPNAWILYRSVRVKGLTESGQAPKRQSDLSKLVASMWREESADVKEVYSRKASIEAKLHLERNPGYSYKPSPSGQPRRKPSKKANDGPVARPRSRTTSALRSYLSDFSIDTPESTRHAIPSVLLPSPMPFEPSRPLDYNISAASPYEDCPFTPSTLSSYGSTLPSSPNSSASEAWTMFQASFDDSALPTPFSDAGPCSAPARVSTFPFSFSQPRPVFEPFHAIPYESRTALSAEPSCASSSSISSYDPSVPGDSASTYEDFLASLPMDQSGQLSVPVFSPRLKDCLDPTADDLLFPPSHTPPPSQDLRVYSDPQQQYRYP